MKVTNRTAYATIGCDVQLSENDRLALGIELDKIIDWLNCYLEDIINDVYEHDSAYFHQNIATSEHFDSLRSLYKDEFKRNSKQITWEDM